MNEKYVLPLFVNQNKRLSRLNVLNIKWLIIIVVFMSTLALYLLFMNLPEIQKQVDLRDFFVPDVHGRVVVQEQQPPPPIDDLNKKDHVDIIKKKTSQTPKTALKASESQKNDKDTENTKRRETVKQMANLAWKNYEKYAWGQNELKPISKTGHSAGIFGASTQLGATIVDGLDTLYIMGYMDAYNKGRDWIEKNFNMNIDSDVSAFEINIRFVGGLLSMYTLTEDKVCILIDFV